MIPTDRKNPTSVVMEDVIDEYRSSLEDLTFNSKPHINNLTILADESKQYAQQIVKLVEEKLSKASAKLPIMYLLDSIVKNVGENYKPLFAENIVNTFRTVFESSDDKAKMSLYKLRTTWDSHFPLKRLYQLDQNVQTLDPNWPVKPLPASLQEAHAPNIHVNPKFLKKAASDAAVKKNKTVSNKPAQNASAMVPGSDVDKIKQQLVQQQKELLELQQKKLMLELEQTKQQLEAKQKELTKSAVKKGDAPVKDHKAKQISKGSFKVTVQNPTISNSSNDQSVKKPTRDPRVKKPIAVKNSVATPRLAAPTVKPQQPQNVPRITPKLKKNLKRPTATTALSVPTDKSPVSPKNKVVTKVKDSTNVKLHKKKKQNSDMSLSPSSDADTRKKRNYRNKTRSPTPPPSKIPKRSVSPLIHPPPTISPDSNVRRDPRILQHNRHKPHFPEKIPQLNEISQSSDGSLSPSFSPEPDTDDSPAERSGFRHRNKRVKSFERIQRRKSFDPSIEIPQELTLSHQNEILRQADSQLQSGQLTHEQHQELLKKLHQLFELQRVRKIEGGVISPIAARRSSKLLNRSPSPTDPRVHRQMYQNNNHNHPKMIGKRGRHLGSPRAIRGRGHFPGMSGRHPEIELAPPTMKRIPKRHMTSQNISHPQDRRPSPPPFEPQPYSSDPNYDQTPVHMRPYPENRHMRISPPRETRRFPTEQHGRPLRRPEFPPQQRTERDAPGKDVRRRSPPSFHLSPPKFMKADRGRTRSKPHGNDHKNLRMYAHSEESQTTKDNQNPDPRNRRSETQMNISSDSSTIEDNSKPKLEEPEDYIIANIPKSDDERGLEEPEDYIIANIPNKEEKTTCEEPEDFIIASMPPEAKVYHEHSIGLKKNTDSEKAYMDHLKKIKQSMYTKELRAKQAEEQASSTTIEESASDQTTDANSENDQPATKRIDDPLKSPPLPLKKRRYVSAESEVKVKKEQLATGDATSNVNDTPKPEEISNDSAKPTVDLADTGVERQNNVSDEIKTSVNVKQEEIKGTDMPEKMSTDPVPPTFDDFKDKLDDNSLVYVIDEEDEPETSQTNSQPPPSYRGKFDHGLRRGRFPPRPPLHPRHRDFLNQEEERIQWRLADEQKNMEWEDSLRHQLEREERWGPERRRGALPPRFGRGRGGPRPRMERWHSPEHEMGEPPMYDLARGRISGRPLPRRPPVRLHPRREPPPFSREGGFRTISPPPPPPDFVLDPRRPLSPPPRRFPPPLRHPHGPPDRGPGWDRPHREERFPPGPPPPDDRHSPVGLQIEPPPPPPAMNQVNVNKLLSDLLTMGILPGAKKPDSKPSTPTPPDHNSQTSVKSEPSEKTEETAKHELPKSSEVPALADPAPPVEDTARRSLSPLDEDLLTIDPDANLPDIPLTSDLKVRHDEIIKRLYTGIQCSACGLRFTTRQTDIYAEHLDWHYRLNRKDKEGGAQVHRELYPSAGEWICNEEIEDPQDRERNAFFDGPEEENENEDLTVPLTGKSGEDLCKVCKEAFETVYNEAEDEWQFTNCVKVDDDNFHPSCYEDYMDAPPVQTPIRTSLSPLPSDEAVPDAAPAIEDPYSSSDDEGPNIVLDQPQVKIEAASTPAVAPENLEVPATVSSEKNTETTQDFDLSKDTTSEAGGPLQSTLAAGDDSQLLPDFGSEASSALECASMEDETTLTTSDGVNTEDETPTEREDSTTVETTVESMEMHASAKEVTSTNITANASLESETTASTNVEISLEANSENVETVDSKTEQPQPAQTLNVIGNSSAE